MSDYCYICEETYTPYTYKFIYCLINTRNRNKNYFIEQPVFAFDYDFLKVELIRVQSDSDEYNTALENNFRLNNNSVLFKQ